MTNCDSLCSAYATLMSAHQLHFRFQHNSTPGGVPRAAVGAICWGVLMGVPSTGVSETAVTPDLPAVACTDTCVCLWAEWSRFKLRCAAK